MATETRNKTLRVFDSWLSEVSPNSRASYSRVVPQFFQMVLEKEINDITEFDLESLTPVMVNERYVSLLKAEGYKNATVSNYLSVVRSFVAELELNKVFKDMNFGYVKEKALKPKRLKNDVENRTTMSGDEYEEFYNWLLNKDWSKRYADKGKKYAAALKFMYVTAVRVDATFNNIKWSDIKLQTDGMGNKSYVVFALDKGKKINKKPISNEFFYELRDVLNGASEEDLLFGDISKQTFTRMMKEFSDEIGTDITPHSIKVGAGTKLYNMTRDLVKVQHFLDHEDPKTTIRYIRTNNDFTDSGSYVLSSNISIDIINDIEYSELVKLIKAKPEIAFNIIQEAKRRGVVNG